MDIVFKALSDPARRELICSLHRENGQTLRQLEQQFKMSRFGVMRHLNVLEEAALIRTVRKGRFKHHYVNLDPLRNLHRDWLQPLLDSTPEVVRAI